MGFLTKKAQELEKQEANVNLAKATSEKAASVIKEISGKNVNDKKKIPENVIMFTNASGGAGASTILSNVAFSISQLGLKVLIIDLNLCCPIQHAYLGIQQEIEKNDIVTYLLGKAKLNDCIDSRNPVNILYANNRGISDELNCNESIAVSNFEQALNNVKDYYDVVLIDCPMRIDSMLCNVAMYKCDAIYMVWDEGLSSVINTERIRRNMAFTGIDSYTKMRIILNKRTSIHFSEYPITKLNLELVEILPFDIDIIDNSLKGQVFCNKGDSSSKNAIKFARKINDLADKILKIGGYTN